MIEGVLVFVFLTAFVFQGAMGHRPYAKNWISNVKLLVDRLTLFDFQER